MRPTDSVRVHLVIAGRVQGVFFRASMREKAEEIGVAGWVRNRADGSVEAVVEGPRKLVEQVVDWAHEGPSRAAVDSVHAVEEPFEGLSRFTIV